MGFHQPQSPPDKQRRSYLGRMSRDNPQGHVGGRPGQRLWGSCNPGTTSIAVQTSITRSCRHPFCGGGLRKTPVEKLQTDFTFPTFPDLVSIKKKSTTQITLQKMSLK